MRLGNVGLEWLIPARSLMAIIVAVFHLLLYYQALSLGITLGWSFLLFSYLHNGMHEGALPSSDRKIERS